MKSENKREETTLPFEMWPPPRSRCRENERRREEEEEEAKGTGLGSALPVSRSSASHLLPRGGLDLF